MAKQTAKNTTPSEETAVVTSPSVDGAEEVSQLKAALAEQSAQHAKEMAEIKGALLHLKKAQDAAAAAAEAKSQQVSPPKTVDDTPQHRSEYERRIAHLERRIAEQENRRDLTEKALAEGTYKYQCDLKGENRMGRIVGAETEHHARSKYLEFFGVRSTTGDVSVKMVE